MTITTPHSVIGLALNITTGAIDAIFVDRDYFRQGLAKAMMNFRERMARQAGLRTVQLDATLNAAAFYRARG